jgi:hypothetical protein
MSAESATLISSIAVDMIYLQSAHVIKSTSATFPAELLERLCPKWSRPNGIQNHCWWAS